jgi:hypothetical protein
MRLFTDTEVCDGNIKVDLFQLTYFKTNRKYLDHIIKYQHPKDDCTMELS